MRVIIDGLRYDTETATEIATATQGRRGDFAFAEETLYRTPRGRYFLHGYGGPLTRWSRREGNGMWAGEGILPLSEEKAIEWLEANELYDELEETFPEAVQDA